MNKEKEAFPNGEIKGYRFDRFFLDVDRGTLIDETDGSTVKLTSKGFKILLAMVGSPSHISIKDLVNDASIDLKTDNAVAKNAKDKIYASVHEIRGKLKDEAVIHKDGGYVFNYEVETVYRRKPVKILFLAGAGIAALALIVLSIPSLSAFMLKTDDGLIELTIDKATVHLDLNDGWRNLTKAEREQGTKLSQGVFNMNYRVRKHFEISTLAQRLGTFSHVEPEWKTHSRHQIVRVKDILDDSKKCSSGLVFAKMLYLDIRDEKVREPFDLSFSTFYFNAHNKLQNESHSFFIHRPVEHLEFKISFPSSMPYPKAIRLQRQQNCSDVGGENMPKNDSSANPKDFVVESVEDKTISWNIESPLVNRIYKIEWDWE